MDLWRSINKKLNARLNGIHWALLKNTKLPLINGFSSHAVLIPLISFHLISLLCPLNNKFPNLNTKKIYNKFLNQLRKKKKKKTIPCMGVTDDVLREKGEKKR